MIATMSDGTERDVTADAKFDTLNEGVAKVTPAGIASTIGQGETTILVRYQGHASLARLTVPYGSAQPFAWNVANVIDDAPRRKWRSLGLALVALFAPMPSSSAAPCSTRSEPRRPSRKSTTSSPIPTPISASAKLVDRLLERPEYVDFWALKWGDILRVNGEKLGKQGMLAFNLWPPALLFARICRSTAWWTNWRRPKGRSSPTVPRTAIRVATGPDDLAETTAQVFMGVRLQCAKCHHHPFEAYGQDDYYGLAAYFGSASVRRGARNSASSAAIRWSSMLPTARSTSLERQSCMAISGRSTTPPPTTPWTAAAYFRALLLAHRARRIRGWHATWPIATGDI